MQRLWLGAALQNLKHLERLAYRAGKIPVFLRLFPHGPPSAFRYFFTHLAVNLNILAQDFNP